MKKKIGLWVLIFDLIVINTLVGYVLWKIETGKPKGELTLVTPVPASVDCSEDCKLYTDTKIAELILPTVVPTAKAQTPATPKSSRNTTYITIPSGTTTKNDWETIIGSDFYLSKNDHPGLIGVYLEGSIKLTNSNGTGLVRLLDVTHGITPAGGELTTKSSTLTFTATGKIYLWEGYNHYQVQLKSTSSDIMTFSDGRLKIITEQ